MTDMFYDFLQDQEIERTGAASRRRDESQRGEIHKLQKQVAKLRLVCQAMCELLCEQTGMDHETIMERVVNIDLRDGKLDGQMGAVERECSGCGRVVRSDRANCFYCGHKLEGADGLDSIL